MDLIQELSFILSNNKPTEFDAYIPPHSKLRQLYELVTLGKVQNDEEAANVIYESSRSDKRYLMLKRNLVQKLSDMVYLYPYTDSEEAAYATIQFQLEKELTIAEKLLLQNVYHNPSKIIAKVEQTAEKYFFIDMQVLAAKSFRSVYALKGFPKETQAYDEKVSRLMQYQHYYNASRGMWEKLYSQTKFVLSKTAGIIQEANAAATQIRAWLAVYENPFMRLYFLQIKILSAYQNDQQAEVLQYIQALEAHVQAYPFIKDRILSLSIPYYYARYYRDTKNLKRAEESVFDCYALCDYRAFNKFQIQELYFDILIKMEAYTQALELLNEVVTVAQFEFLNPYDQSAWALREAFIYFIFYQQNDEEALAKLRIFGQAKSLHVFLEQSKKSVKDKYGYNINLLIARVILFKINGLSDVDNEGNNMKVYAHRYLKAYKNTRTGIFFTYLSKVASRGFDAEELQIWGEKLEKKLQALGNETYAVHEIIPYPKLWKLLIDIQKKPLD